MRNIKALADSTMFTILLIVALTIAAELSKAFKSTLASITGHHWVSKSLISLAMFFVLYWIISKRHKERYDVKNLAIKTFIITVISSLIVFLFYVYEFAK